MAFAASTARSSGWCMSSCSELRTVGSGLSDRGVRWAGWPVGERCASVGAGGVADRDTHPEWAAPLHRRGHQAEHDRIAARQQRGPNVNRRLNQWTKDVLAEALSGASERRSSALSLVNAAYTSQVAPLLRLPRQPGRGPASLHPVRGRVAGRRSDHAAAINVSHRHGAPDISLRTPHKRVRQTLQDRDRRSEETAPPDSDPPPRRVDSETSLTTRSPTNDRDRRKGSR